MNDVVFGFFRVTWSLSRQRGAYFAQDRLATALVDHPDIDRLLIADAYRSRIGRLARSRGTAQPDLPTPSTIVFSPHRLRRHDPGDLRLLASSYRRYSHRLDREVARAGLTGASLLTTNPFLAAFASAEWATSITWYATDDYHAAGSLAPWHRGFEDAYRRIRERGVGVCAVSKTLLDRVRPSGPGRVVPNGVDPREWEAPGPPPAWLRRLPRPWLVYTGGLDDRVDAAALRSVADSTIEGTVVLLGPLLDPAHLAHLEGIPGVVRRPPVDREELAATVAAADVCLLPHRRTSLTEAMSPLKLFEYLAAGRPVASIDLPPVRAVAGRVALAATPDHFGDAVEQALALGPAPDAERRQFVADNSWSRRHSRILELALEGR